MHPFFLAAYPTLFILAVNLKQIPVSQSFRPLGISLVLAVILVLLFGVVSAQYQQGAVSASLVIVLFFTYGHFHRWLESEIPQLASHALLGAIWLLLLLLGMMVKWKIKDIHAFTNLLNGMGAALLVFPVLQIAIFLAQTGTVVNTGRVPPLMDQSSSSQRAEEASLPDIYYIILDGYGRSDILQELYGYDNSEFIRFLRESGFTVTADSHSNYAHTTLSLASSLNLEYVGDIYSVDGDTQSREPLVELIKHSEVRTFLENRGYKTIAFQTGSGDTMITDADIFISYRPSIVNDLEGLLITSSALRMFGEKVNNLFSPFTCLGHQGSIRNIFTNLALIPSIPGPQFVFAHIMSPHPPFVFGPDGDRIVQGECSGFDGSLFEGSSAEYRDGYRGQVEYITELIQDAVEKILARSTTPPIIIIQSDHGPGLFMDFDSSENTCIRERFSILNAYYLPGMDSDRLYGTVTPVNSFRIVLNNYFDTDLPLLEDKLFYSTKARLYEFEEVTDRLEESCRY